MREGWTYKKLGEVCEIYQPKTISKKDCLTNGDYLVYGANGVIGTYNEYNHENSEVLLGCRGTVGNVIVSKPYSWINGNAMVIHPKNTDLLQFFLAYQLRGIDLSSVITGVAQPQITRQALSPTIIAIPSISIQQQIVSELDLLSSVIEKQKTQIEELDKLAQSIFYDMFGDPVENEKGWEVKKLSEVAPQTEYKGEISNEDGKFWLLNLDMVKSQTGEIINKCLFEKEEIGNSTISFNEDNVLYSKLRPYLNKVVLPQESGYGTSELVPLKPDPSRLNRVFLALLLRSKQFVEYINIKVQGAKMPRVSMTVLRSFPIILPPLSLQQEFADKIQAIESMKAKVRQSLKESETLFNSRMDFYFS